MCSCVSSCSCKKEIFSRTTTRDIINIQEQDSRIHSGDYITCIEENIQSENNIIDIGEGIHSVKERIHCEDDLINLKEEIHFEDYVVHIEDDFDSEDNIIHVEEDIHFDDNLIHLEEDIQFEHNLIHKEDGIQSDDNLIHVEEANHCEDYFIQVEGDYIHYEYNCIQSEYSSIHTEEDFIHSEDNLIHSDEDFIHSEDNLIHEDNKIITLEDTLISVEDKLIRPDINLIHAKHNLIRNEHNYIHAGDLGNIIICDTVVVVRVSSVQPEHCDCFGRSSICIALGNIHNYSETGREKESDSDKEKDSDNAKGSDRANEIDSEKKIDKNKVCQFVEKFYERIDKYICHIDLSNDEVYIKSQQKMKDAYFTLSSNKSSVVRASIWRTVKLTHLHACMSYTKYCLFKISTKLTTVFCFKKTCTYLEIAVICFLTDRKDLELIVICFATNYKNVKCIFCVLNGREQVEKIHYDPYVLFFSTISTQKCESKIRACRTHLRVCEIGLSRSEHIIHNNKSVCANFLQHNEDSTSGNGNNVSSQNQIQDRFTCLIYELAVTRRKCQTSILCWCSDCSSTFNSAGWCFDNQNLAKRACSLHHHPLRSSKYRSLHTCDEKGQLSIKPKLPPLHRKLELSPQTFSSKIPHFFLGGTPQKLRTIHSHLPRYSPPTVRSQSAPSPVPSTSRAHVLYTRSTIDLCLPEWSFPHSRFTRNFMPSSVVAWLGYNTVKGFSNKKGNYGRRETYLWNFSLIFLLLHILFRGLPSVRAQGLVGTVSTCENEGKEVEVPSITDNPCIKCVCKNHQVECEPKRCRNVEGCHAILFDQPSKMCCEVCKGCRYQGAQYDSGDSWTDKKDLCKQYSCRAGVVSISRIQCFSHCYNTVIVPGQCCRACDGCFFRGHTYDESEKFKLPTDVCTTCTCQNSKLLCEREQCPVLNCPPEVIFHPKNECCPQCKGQRPVFDVPSQCYFAKSVYKKNQKFQPNSCSKCVCKVTDKSSGTAVCETETCPALDCPEAERHTLEGSQCCLSCLKKRPCVFDGRQYKDKEEWKPNVCLKCLCEDGVTYCQRERCSNSLWCPQGYKLLLTENECCPKCIEHDAVCSVFGDPHYRTFDGLMYSFQGTCKYILTRDCSNNDFLIKVRNGVRFSSGFAWTQMLVVFVYKHRISLLQNSVVKIDKRRARLPYIKAGMFSVSKEGELVKLTTALGLDVTWDGDSFLEVTVTTKYKHRLCGLCGNYNGIKSDDLIGKDGTIYMNGDDFGHSWRIGSTRGCKVRPHFLETHSSCKNDILAKQRAHRVCSIFYSRVFSKCRQKVSVDVYVSSCLTDMCDCPEGHYCACEAIRAYSSQCTRSGFQIVWDKMKNCQAPHDCPHSATKVDCAVICPKTCKRPHGEDPCPEECHSGCMCEAGRVLDNGECIPTTACPRR